MKCRKYWRVSQLIHHTRLINISMGMHATNEVQDSLLTAADKEGKMCEHFVYSAFSVDQSGSVCNHMPKFKKKCEHMSSKSNLKYKSGELISCHINPDVVFDRSKDKLNSKNTMCHELLLFVAFKQRIPQKRL